MLLRPQTVGGFFTLLRWRGGWRLCAFGQKIHEGQYYSDQKGNADGRKGGAGLTLKHGRQMVMT
jgi:hypothetical protein